jgi:DNA primase
VSAPHTPGQQPGQDSCAVRIGNLARIDFNRVRAPEETLAQLKARVDLVEVVARYVELKQKHRGGHWWACCPFHKEAEASFKVNPGLQAFICFGCGAKGDVFDFIAKAERLDTGDAIRRVREIAGGGDAPVVDSAFRIARQQATKQQEAIQERLNRDRASRW